MYYFKGKHNSRLTLDPTYPAIFYENSKTDKEYTSFYAYIGEVIPLNYPTPLGNRVDLRMMVDIEHTGDNTTRRSRTGFMIFVNLDLIQLISKKQPTVESAVFRSEFVAMNHRVETIRSLWYKLMMMGVPIEGPSYIYGYNMSVIYNTLRPESVLTKKFNLICYHFVREAVAAKECLTIHNSHT